MERLESGEAYLAALRARPEVKVDEAHFREMWEKCECPPVDRAPDLLLAAGIVHGDPAAVEWLRKWVRHAANSLVSRHLPQHLVADLESQVLHSVAVAEGGRPPRIANYRGRAPIESWLRVVTVRTARALSTPRAEFADDAELESLVLKNTSSNVEEHLIRQNCRGVVALALRAAAAQLTGRHRALIAMHYLDGLSIDEIGVAYGVHRATAARWLADARASFLEATRDQVATRVKINRLEVDSVVRAVQSQLDVSLRMLFSDRA